MNAPTVEPLNHLPADELAKKLLYCCGSQAWVQRMLTARPYLSMDDLIAKAAAADAQLSHADWKEAFAAHPEIGTKSKAISKWEAQEQRGASTAAETTLDQLAAGNQDYKARFGYIYIVCATGKSADEMLQILQRRLTHSAADELPVAAHEQSKITIIRLRKLVDEYVAS
ncbi:Aste57867_18423 [Aphanomyces stellatus]|uniref:2-oxo-4-hydroxy-4-carboxy-5-ureidoimidazoline decarboxylase n=1 Tax=Aphanomyces stellatus TaxID=120398 RepID=A0A485LAA7_9STRA|nr:hypothetical protein As57867_018361 [Aphanomyces stellatus]VFT95159.1 Aste57867_18423 [Aphanomyces stellatus]